MKRPVFLLRCAHSDSHLHLISRSLAIHKAGGSILSRLQKVLPRLLQNPHESFTSESQQKCTELITVALNPTCTPVSIEELKYIYTHTYTPVYSMSGPHPRSIKTETRGMVLNNILLVVLAKEQPGLLLARPFLP